MTTRGEVVPNTETALLPAPFWCTKRVEPAHFDWHWRERPALALLAWEACSRSVDEATPHPRGVNWKRQLILGQWLSPIPRPHREKQRDRDPNERRSIEHELQSVPRQVGGAPEQKNPEVWIAFGGFSRSSLIPPAS